MEAHLHSSAGTSGSCSTQADSSERADMGFHACSSAAAHQPSTRHTPRRPHASRAATAWLTLLTIALLFSPCSARARSARNSNQGRPNVISALQKAGLQPFVELISKAGLLATFQDPNWSGTLFAPQNTAAPNSANSNAPQVNTNQLPSDLLRQVILYHTLSATLIQGQLKHGAALPTAAGQNLYVDRQNKYLKPFGIRGFTSAARYIKQIRVNNAVIHVIANTLYPNMGAVAGCSSGMDLILKLGLRDFYKLVVYAGMEGQVNSGTVMVPSNKALDISNVGSIAQAQAMVSAYLMKGGMWTQYSMPHSMVLDSQRGTRYTVYNNGNTFGLRRGGRLVRLSRVYLGCTASVYPISVTLP